MPQEIFLLDPINPDPQHCDRRTVKTQYRKFETTFPRKGIVRFIPNFHIHVSVSDFIYPGSVCLFSFTRIGDPIVGIYKSLIDTCMWKLGLRPRNSFSVNT